MNAQHLELNPPAGIVAHNGYDAGWFDVLAAVEERHFWFRSRTQVIAEAFRPLIRDRGPVRLLEAGCGNGNVLRALKALCPDGTGSVTGMDLFENGLEHARARCQCELVAGNILNPPFSPASFDLVGMFDVLEHLPDDGRAVRSVHSLLAPGGALVITVPAGPELWSSFDEVAGHYRRYTHATLSTLLEQNGFQPVYVTYFMSAIYPLVRAARRRRSTRPEAGSTEAFEQALKELRVRPVLNGILYRLLSWEKRWIARRRRLPFGTSLIAIAEKKPELRH